MAKLRYPANNDNFLAGYMIDTPIDTKRLFWISFYRSNIDLDTIGFATLSMISMIVMKSMIQ